MKIFNECRDVQWIIACSESESTYRCDREKMHWSYYIIVQRLTSDYYKSSANFNAYNGVRLNKFDAVYTRQILKSASPYVGSIVSSLALDPLECPFTVGLNDFHIREARHGDELFQVLRAASEKYNNYHYQRDTFTLLHIAAKLNKPWMVATLLDDPGCVIDALCSKGKTALQWAIDADAKECIEIMRNHPKQQAIDAAVAKAKEQENARITAEKAKLTALVLDVSQNKVTEINFSNNPYAAAYVQELANALRVNQTVTKINLSKTKLGIDSVKVLAAGLKVNQAVVEIDLSNNPVGDAGMLYLAEALKLNKSLTRINLCATNLGTESAKALAEIIKANPSLEVIDLSNNPIGDASMLCLLEVLTLAKSLRRINLCKTEFGSNSAEALAKILKINSPLAVIDLSNNRIDAYGAKMLAGGLRVNRMVTDINLGHNRIGSEGGQDLLDAMQVNWAITKIDLQGNNISDFMMAKIDLCRERNENMPPEEKHRLLSPYNFWRRANICAKASVAVGLLAIGVKIASDANVMPECKMM